MPREQEQDDPDYVVFGAGGPTGLHVLETLIKQGFKVKAVVRSPENHGEIVYVAKKLEDEPFGDAEVKLVKGDVTDYASVLEHCKGAKGAFFTASGKGYLSASAVDHKGVENVARAAKAHGLDRVVIVSSAFVSPHRYLHPIRVILNSIRFRLMDYKYQGEEALRRSGVPYAIVRPGRLTDGVAGEALWEVSQGDASGGGGGVARADVARLAVAAMLAPEAENTTFEVFGVEIARRLEPAEALRGLLRDPARPPIAAEAAAEPGSEGSGAAAGAKGEKKKEQGASRAAAVPSSQQGETLPEASGVFAKVCRTLVMLP